MSGGLLSGSLVAPDSQLVLAPDSSLTYAIRCQNTSRIWSTWREVTITKAPAMDTPGSSTDSAPEAPIIRGADFSTSASVGAPTGFSVPFTFRSVDADGDTLRYHIDWDNDGILDQIAPASGFVPSGTAETTNYLWLRAGTYTFAVKAEDRTRRSSSWTTHTIVISNGHSSVAPVAPQMTLTLSRYLVRTDETVTATLVVRADYPVSCILYGVTGGSYTVHYPGGVGEMTYLKDTDPLRASQIVRGVCTPEGSGVALGRETREKQVRVVPTVEEI